jgi:hypothetical protein
LRLMISSLLTVPLKNKFQWKKWSHKQKVPKPFKLPNQECFLRPSETNPSNRNLHSLINLHLHWVHSRSNSNKNGFRSQNKLLKSTKKSINKTALQRHHFLRQTIWSGLKR